MSFFIWFKLYFAITGYTNNIRDFGIGGDSISFGIMAGSGLNWIE
jgi:hypothetical protein